MRNEKDPDNGPELSNFIDFVDQCLDASSILADLIDRELAQEIKDHLRKQCHKLHLHLDTKNNYDEFYESLKIENKLLAIAITRNQTGLAWDVILIILESLRLILDESGNIIIRGIQELFEIIKVTNQYGNFGWKKIKKSNLRP